MARRSSPLLLLALLLAAAAAPSALAEPAKAAAPLAAKAPTPVAAKAAAPLAAKPSTPVAVAALVAAKKNSAPAPALDCAAVLSAAAKACAPELTKVDAKARVASASAPCCAAAAKVYSPAFASACACKPEVLRAAARLTAARAAAQGACPALKAAAAAIPACPSAAAARNGVLGDTPAWGTGSVCTSVDAPKPRNSPCAVRCTSSATPTDSQIASAKNCASRTKGFCEGLGVDGATSGLTQCDRGIEVADPRNRGRKCFQCCTTRLAPVGTATRGKNACKNPNSGGGGGGGGGCFPGDATVTLESGSRVAMRDLQIGDRVMSADPKTGAVSFEDVYFFAHMSSSADAASEFVRLEADGGRATMELTRKHLVPTLPGPVYKRAIDVAVGDVVLVVAHEDGKTREAEITAAATVVRSGAGLYAPLTTGGGHVVVDGMTASVHSDFVLDALFEKLGRVSSLHGAYEKLYGAPLRALYRLAGPSAVARANPLLSAVVNGEAAGAAAVPAGAAAVRALFAGATATARKA